MVQKEKAEKTSLLLLLSVLMASLKLSLEGRGLLVSHGGVNMWCWWEAEPCACAVIHLCAVLLSL